MTRNTEHTAYFTRHMPRALLARLKRTAAAMQTTLEDCVNIALELGVSRMEPKKGGKK